MKLISWVWMIALTAIAVFGALILYRKLKVKPVDTNVTGSGSVEAITVNKDIFKVDPNIFRGMGAKNDWGVNS